MTSRRAESIPQHSRWPSFAERLIDSRGKLPLAQGEIDVQNIARTSKAINRELAYVRDRATGQRHLRDVGPQMGQVPSNSRLIVHSHPGEGFMSVIPSSADREALKSLGQKSSVVVNFDGTKSARFRPESRNDGGIWQYKGGRWVFPED